MPGIAIAAKFDAWQSSVDGSYTVLFVKINMCII